MEFWFWKPQLTHRQSRHPLQQSTRSLKSVLKNRLFLPPLQHLPHSPSLPLKPISQRLQTCSVTHPPNSFVLLFLGKGTLTTKTVDVDRSWKTQRSRTLLTLSPVRHPWEMYKLTFREGRSWNVSKNLAQTKEIPTRTERLVALCDLKGRSSEF